VIAFMTECSPKPKYDSGRRRLDREGHGRFVGDPCALSSASTSLHSGDQKRVHLSAAAALANRNARSSAQPSASASAKPA
jgi:hypothetical protein